MLEQLRSKNRKRALARGLVAILLLNNILPVAAHIAQQNADRERTADVMLRALGARFVSRAPRPGAGDTIVPSGDGTSVCCELPRDVAIAGTLSVGGNVIVQGSVITTTADLSGRQLTLFEDPINGTDAITIEAPASLPASYTLFLPSTAGLNNQVLITDGTGVTDWVTIGAAAGAFVQYGNAFGVAGELGTNDNFGLNFRTNGVDRLSIANTGSVGVADLAGTGDRIIQANASGVLSASIPTGTKNIVYVVKSSPVIVGKYYANVNDAVDWANSNATEPTAIVIAPGNYTVADTITVTNPFLCAIMGVETTSTTLVPSPALVGSPVIDLIQTFSVAPFVLQGFSINGYGVPGWQTTPGSVGVMISGDSRFVLQNMYLTFSYNNIAATGGSGVGVQFAVVNDSFLAFSGDCGVLASNGANVIVDNCVIAGSGTQQIRAERPNGAAVTTQVTVSGGQLSNEMFGTGDGILAKDVSRVRTNSVRALMLQNIFTVEDDARLECSNNVQVDGALTHYRQLSSAASIIVNGDVVNGHELEKFVITNSANVSFNLVDATTGERCVGSFTDQDNFLFTILTGHGVDDPYYHYENEWFGLRGLVADFPNASLTGVTGGMKTIASMNKDAVMMSLVRGLSAHSNKAGVQLSTYQSDGDPSSPDLSLLRSWGIAKEPSTHNLDMRFWDGAVENTRMTLTPAGHVGIGTTVPGSTLEIGVGQLAVPAGTASNPSYAFAGDLDTGIYSPANDIIGFAAAGAQRMRISGSGVVTIPGMSSVGVVHNDASGNLSTSLIVNNDITNGTITDTKLATITTAGKVANSATTATSSNTANAIVARDASGNFAAGTITASLSGAASNNVLKSGDTMTGALLMGNQNQLRLGDTGSNYVAFQAPTTIPTSYTLTWPTAQAGANQVLTNNGSGALSWQDGAALPGVIKQGGNAFGVPMIIGTTDNFAVNIATNGTNRASISNAGVVNIANVSGTGDRLVQASSTGDVSALIPTGIKNIVQVIQNSPVVIGKFYPDIKSAVDWANANATVPTAIVIAPGIYSVNATISVTNNFVRSIVGTQASAVNVVPTAGLAGNPIFLLGQTSSSPLPFEIKDITISGIGVVGWAATPGSVGVKVTGYGSFSLNRVFAFACYQCFAFIGDGSANIQRVSMNSCLTASTGDAGIVVDDGANVTIVNTFMAAPGTHCLRAQQTNALAPQTKVQIITCQCFNDATGTGTAIFAKDTAIVTATGIFFRNLQRIFVVQDSARLECLNNIRVVGSVTNYEQLTSTAHLIVYGDVVADARNTAKFIVTNSANVSFNIIDEDNGESLIGNLSDSDSPIFVVFDGHGANDPSLAFKQDWFGLRGLVYESPQASLTGVTGGMNINSVVAGNSVLGALVRGTTAASYAPAVTLATYASNGDPASPDLSLLRRWSTTKLATNHNLQTSFWDGSAENNRLTLTPSGRLGIGTTTPGTTLEIGAGQIAAPAGTAVNPSFALATDLDTGMYFPADDVIGFAASGAERMSVSGTGVVTIPGLSSAGVVHNDASGNLSTSLIVNNDIANSTITDAKLQTIATAGKVANSATTATAANTASAIVARDASGNFSAGTITANFIGNVAGDLIGNVTGAASNNVLKSGDTMTGSLILSGGGANLTVGGLTDLQALNVHGNLHAYGTTYFDQGVPGLSANELVVTTGALSGPNQFNSVKAALDSITTNSELNPFVVKVGPGLYVEDPMVLPSFVTLSGESALAAIIAPTNPNVDLITAQPYSIMSGIQLLGVTGAGSSGYRFNGGGIVGIETCIFRGCDTFINIDSINAPYSIVYIVDTLLDEAADFVTAVKVRSTGGYPTSCTIDGLVWQGVTNTTIDSLIDIAGAPCRVFADTLDVASIASVSGTAIKMADGAIARIRSSALKNFATGILIANTGAGAFVDISAVSGVNNTVDLNIAHPGASGVVQAEFSYNKVVIDPAADIAMLLLDPSNHGTVTVGPEYYGNSVGQVTNISVELEQGSCLGVVTGGEIADGGGLNVTVAAGTGYLMVGTAPNDYLKYVTWDAQVLALSPNVDTFIYVDDNGIVQSSFARPDHVTAILIGKATTDASMIAFLQVIPTQATHTGNEVDQTLRQGFGPVYRSGSLVSKNGDLQLDVTAGSYFFGTLNYLPSGGTAIAWDAFYRNGVGGETINNAQASVDYNHYDDGTGTLAVIPVGEYARHAFYVVNDGVDEHYLLVYGQTTYASLLAAQNGTIPPAPGTWSDNIALIASIIVQNTVIPANQIAEIRDERPRLGFKASGVSVITQHNDLSGRGFDDCHPQYFLVSGVTPMGGNLDMGTNNVVNSGTYNGVTVQAHAARHLPNGADPLTTDVPVTIATVNAIGLANSFSRSDHVHAHGAQTDPALHAPATPSTAGFMSAADKTLLDSIDPSLYVLKTGSTMTGGLIINPAAGNALTVNTNKFIVGATTGNTTVGGLLTLSPLTTSGVLHNNSLGEVSSSLIVNADIDAAAAIVDTKLATIATAGKVSNSATTATSANTPSAIVQRNASGNFNAGSITLEDQGQLCLRESTLNGTASVCLQAPASVTGYTLTVPATSGTSGYVLITDGAGTTNWTAPTSLSGLILEGGNVVAGALSIGTANDFGLNLITNGVSRLHIADSISSGAVTISNLASGAAGVVHADAAGLLSKSLIVNADISAAAAIADTKLATIATAGKVGNSATTATSSNTASAIVARDASGNFSAGTVTATFVGNLTGTVTGSATNNVLKAGDTMTGNLVMANQRQVRLSELTTNGNNYIALQAPASVTADATLTLPDGAGSAGQVLSTDGAGVLSWASVPSTATSIVNGGNAFGSAITIGTNDNFALNFITNATNRLAISTAGVVTVPNLATTGVVHNSAAGLLTTSLIVNADVDPAAAIVDTKLATISTAGKVSNSATTATSSNTANAIVARDASGNFGAGTITANLTGSASNNVLKSGDAMTGTLVMSNQKQVRFAEQTINGSNYIAIQAPDSVTTDTIFTLPDGAGSANQVLTTDGAGVLSWQSATALPGVIIAGGNTMASALSIGTANDFGLHLITNGTTRLSIADSMGSGEITIPSLASTGVVHANGAGLLSTSLIVNADISASAAISDTKLAAISSAGKVVNSATTATSANTASAIVARDASGNFAAGTITAAFTGNLTGNVTGSASNNVLKAGDSMTGNLVMSNQKQLRLGELTSNGVNYVALQAPASVTADTVLTLPDGAGSSGQALTTDGSGVLSWTTIPSTTTSIVNGGNSFGSAITIGTNDSFALNFTTDALQRVHISSTGAVTINTPTSGVGLTIAGGGLTTTGTTTLSSLTSGLLQTNGSGVVSHLTPTTHAVQVGNGTTITSLATGSSGQILQSGGAGADPAWTTSTYPSTNAQGDLVYGSAANTLTTLAKNTTATRYLANTGTSNNPNWDQVNLTNGVTGTLPVGSGGTGATTFTSNGILYGNGTSAVQVTAQGGANTVLLGNGGVPSFGQVPNAALANSSITLNNGSNITITGSPVSLGGAATINLANSPSVSGSLTAGTTVTAGTGITSTTGNITATAGNVTTTNGSHIVGSTAAAATANELGFQKSRSGGVITTGDVLGNVTFQGFDGTGYIVGSKIVATSSGTIATNRVASNLEFFTHPDSTTVSTQRMVINSAGNVTVNAPDSGVALAVTGGSAATAQTIAAGTGQTALAITGSTVTAQTITAGTNGRGLTVAGNGTANAIEITAGAGTGGGILITGGAGAGVPLQVTAAAGTGSAATITGGNSASAVRITPGTNQSGCVIATSGTAAQLQLQNPAATFAVGFSAPVLTVNTFYTWPLNTGTSGQVLSTNGSSPATLSWVTAATAANAFVTGGNSFAATAVLGTNDANALNLRTNSTTRLTIDASGNTTYSSNYKANVRVGTTQTVSGAGTATVQFDTVTYDPNSNFNTGTFLYTAPATGYYLVAVNLSATYSNNNSRTLNLIKNGSTVTGYSINTQGTSSAQATGNSFTTIINLIAGDTLGFQIVNTGGNVGIQAANSSMIVHFMSI